VNGKQENKCLFRDFEVYYRDTIIIEKMMKELDEILFHDLTAVMESSIGLFRCFSF